MGREEELQPQATIAKPSTTFELRMEESPRLLLKAGQIWSDSLSDACVALFVARNPCGQLQVNSE